MKSSQRPCKELRRHALAHLSGETSVLEKQRFESHMAQCQSCQKHIGEISTMMETTRSERFLPKPDVKDKMFDGIMALIEKEGPSVSNSSIATVHHLTKRTKVLIAVAATLIAVVTAVIFIESDDQVKPQPTTDVATKKSSANLPSVPNDTALLNTNRLSSTLSIGASPNANYNAALSNGIWELQLKRGRMWIRFSRTPDVQGLHVFGPDLTVNVIGTTLVVEVIPEREETTVGVLEGKVKVTPNTGNSLIVLAGDVRKPNGRVVSMESPLKEQAAHWLAHVMDEEDRAYDKAEQTAAENAASTQPTNGQEHSVKAKEQRRLRDIYEIAEEQMQKGDFRAAAKTLEGLIRTGPQSSRADTARLELARIYTKQLGRSKRAARHLETYLKRHPTGTKSKLIRTRLCQLASKQGIDVSIRCED